MAEVAERESRPKEAPADFLRGGFAQPASVKGVSARHASRFFNRELSWLEFNWRVVGQSENKSNPLLERVRFLSISASNLDEFYSVRVAGLRELVNARNASASIDGKTPMEQLAEVDENVRALLAAQQRIWAGLRKEMEAEGIAILDRDQLTEADRKTLEKVFMSKVFPILTPLAIDPAHPFPFIASTGFALALELRREKDGRELQALLPIPNQVDRFIELADVKQGRKRFLPLEELLLEFISYMFPGYRLVGHCQFRILRDSDLEVEDEAEDLVREFESALKRRHRGEVIRLTLSSSSPKKLRKMVMKELSVRENEVFEVNGLIGIADLRHMVLNARPDLLWANFNPRVPERAQDYDGDMFMAIRQKDMLLHHPYETFDMVVRFLEQAARDPDVVAIKQTLYRTSRESPIVAALCEAAESGKSVTAVVELKARFDEAANIRQSRRLERAGAHVVYGFIKYKTHAKISTVVRREGDRLVTYTHYGTGNYNPVTARVYTDLSLFTCDEALGNDATKAFNYISGYARPKSLSHMEIAPLTLKKALRRGIKAEREFAKGGKPGVIWAKMNALIDPDIIDELYAASCDGVRISLVVRAICGLRPGVKGLSENIRVKSIVGRFLEHSRIVCFGNGNELPSPKGKVYMSSADWMGRNFKRRVETLVEIKNTTVHAQIMEQIMSANMRDEANSWVLRADGTYARQPSGKDLFSCHEFFMTHPSLSGRGTAAGDGAGKNERAVKKILMSEINPQGPDRSD